METGSGSPLPSSSRFVRVFALVNRRVDVLSTPILREGFLGAYSFYKRHFEDPFFRLLKRHPTLLGDGDVYDVGANLGYTANLFRHSLAPSGLVHAFEPEAKNFRLLERRAKRQAWASRVVVVNAAVGDRDGTIELAVNDDHHGDHTIVRGSSSGAMGTRIGGVQIVRCLSLDRYWHTAGRDRKVSFIKIDVQGHEPAVIGGAHELLRRFTDIRVALEFDEAAMRRLGHDPHALVEALASFRGSQIFVIGDDGTLRPFDRAAPPFSKGYGDLLWTRTPLR